MANNFTRAQEAALFSEADYYNQLQIDSIEQGRPTKECQTCRARRPITELVIKSDGLVSGWQCKAACR